MNPVVGSDVLYVMKDGSFRPAKIVSLREQWSVSSKADRRFNAEGFAAVGAGKGAAQRSTIQALAKTALLAPPTDLAVDVRTEDEIALVVFVSGRDDWGLVEHHERSSLEPEHCPCVVARRAKYSAAGEPHTWHWPDAAPPALTIAPPAG